MRSLWRSSRGEQSRGREIRLTEKCQKIRETYWGGRKEGSVKATSQPSVQDIVHASVGTSMRCRIQLLIVKATMPSHVTRDSDSYS